jgi:uncharacterized surface protein with fasciclin (FAS1) repeats
MSNEIVRQVPARLRQGDTATVLQQYESGELAELQANIPPADWDALGIALRRGDANGAQVAVSRYPYFDKPAETKKRSALWVLLAVLALAAVVAGLLIWLSGRNDDEAAPEDTTTTTAPPTTVEETTTTAESLLTVGQIVRSDPQLSVLWGYIVTAGLNGTLSGEAEFTLFAPTDTAFRAAEANAGALLEQITSNQQDLTQILTYHAVAGDLQPLPTESVASVEGSDLALDGNASPPTVNTVPIMETIPASNGVVYVIDQVLIPPNFVAPTTAAPTTEATTTTTVALQNIPATLVTLGNYTTLTAALAATGLEPVLAAAGPFTLWAPNDAAFASLPADQRTFLTSNPDVLRQVLLYHVLQGAAAGADLTTRAYRTAQGQDIDVVVGDPIVVNGTAQVVQPNIPASNGVIYGINQVLIPPDITLPS